MKKKVFILLRSLDVLGGTEIQTLNLGKALISSGYEVTMVLYFNFEKELATHFEADGIKITFLELDENKGLWNTLKGIRLFLQREKPDIVHVQYMNPGLIPILAAKWARIPKVIAQVHQPATHYKKIHKLFVRVAALLSNYFISVSLNTQYSWFGKKQLYEMGRKAPKNFTIYNSLYDVFEPKPELINYRETLEKLNIGVVGRLRWEKGQIYALKAFSIALSKYKNLHLHLVGKGPDIEYLSNECIRLGIGENVTFHGQMNPDQLNQIYHSLHIVIVPSRFEAFGLTVIEAMQFEIPVIAHSVDGLVEVVRNRVDGFLVDVGDVEKMAENIIYLVENREIRNIMGKEGKARVMADFSFPKYQKLINDFYSNI